MRSLICKPRTNTKIYFNNGNGNGRRGKERLLSKWEGPRKQSIFILEGKE
jgi:hypothetical protein